MSPHPKELREERLRTLGNVFDHSPLGICTVGMDGRILTANRALRRMVGVELGRAFVDVVHHDDVGVIQAMYRELADGEVESLATERRYRRADGAVFWGRLTASVVRDDAGSPRHYVAMLEDIDDRRRVDAAMQVINERLESLNRAKSALVSTVSHEFRTALTVMEGFSELLRDEELQPAEARELAADINAEAQRLGRLIDDLLDLDRLEAGRVPQHVQPLDVNAVLATLAGRVRRSTSGHRIEVELVDGLTAIEADPDRLTQVFTNLLSNAVKYSPAGSVIRVTSEPIDDGVRVAIRDNGRGIPPDSLERIFDRYTRLERESGTVTGTGLGLPIVRQIVRMHGGRVWAENAEAGGAVFTVELPLRRRPEEDADADRVL
jgi:PAS domain S-box-containing protein